MSGASVVALPGAASSPVANPVLRGRKPRSIPFLPAVRRDSPARHAKASPSLVGSLHPVDCLDPQQRATVEAARAILRGAAARPLTARPVDSTAYAKDLAYIHLAGLGHEVFAVAFLDAQHRLLRFTEMFAGTLMQTSVYPREVVRHALINNAAAVILAHNHPSGLPEPSRADEHLTATLKAALALVDVRVLDHLVVGADQVVSFAERGLL